MKKIYTFLFLFAVHHLAFGQVYVTPTGAGNRDGSSWTNALGNAELQTAFNTSPAGEIFWLAKGTYTPTEKISNVYSDGVTSTDDRVKSFNIKPGIKIYGGFRGDEQSNFNMDDRDFVLNETEFSGNLGANLNSFHVLYLFIPAATTAETIIDGFTIKDGKADLAAAAETNINPPVSITNALTGYDKVRQDGGAGLHLVVNGLNKTITLNNLKFTDNNSVNFGGAIYISARTTGAGANTINLLNSSFERNTALRGGGIYMHGAAPAFLSAFRTNFLNCTITGDSGGGAYYQYNGGSKFDQCKFLENQQATFAFVGPMLFTRSYFAENTGLDGTCIMLSSNNATTFGYTDISSCIFYNNEANRTGTVDASNFAGGGLIQVRTNTNATIKNSTFYLNKVKNLYGLVSPTNSTSVGLKLYNNIFSGNLNTANNTEVDVRNNNTTIVQDFRHNIFVSPTLFANDVQGSRSLSNNINGIGVVASDIFGELNPAEKYFLYPKPSGIAHNSGDKDLYGNDALLLDYIGNIRTNQSTIDLGAIEFYGVMPVTFKSFNAALINNRTKLNWSVGLEDNVAKYLVERSLNGVDFVTIAEVQANGSKLYNAIDENPKLGLSYYRLTSVDNDGTTLIFGNIATVKVSTLNDKKFNVYPNPLKGNVLNIDLASYPLGNYKYQLKDVTGAIVGHGSVDNNFEDVRINLQDVPVGIYVLTLTKGNLSLASKIIKH